MQFEKGNLVVKTKGYNYDGIIVGKYFTFDNDLRYVVELAYTPLQHIFSPEQLRFANIQEAKDINKQLNNRR